MTKNKKNAKNDICRCGHKRKAHSPAMSMACRVCSCSKFVEAS